LFFLTHLLFIKRYFHVKFHLSGLSNTLPQPHMGQNGMQK
jgi:hypothetical protein